MKQIDLQQVPHAEMRKRLPHMDKDDIQAALHELGCTWSYEDIKAKLAVTYNDLAVADQIFDTQTISDEKTTYPKTFIDEAVLEIAKREDFPFTHYGILSDRVLDLMEQGSEDMAASLHDVFRQLFRCAKHFHVESLEGMIYAINDGVDMMAMAIMLLDLWMEAGRTKHSYYEEIVRFVDKFLKTFPKTSDFFKVSLQYEQAQAYIALHSKKGDAMFEKLIKTHSDPTDVILHYALAYLDDNEIKSRHILKKYRHLLDKKSEAYAAIMDIQQDIKEK